MGRRPSSSDAFRAVADEQRRRLLEQLRGGEQPVGALAQGCGLSFSATSQHLAVLLEAGVVGRRADGRRRLYFLVPAALKPVADWALAFAPLWRTQAAELAATLRDPV